MNAGSHLLITSGGGQSKGGGFFHCNLDTTDSKL